MLNKITMELKNRGYNAEITTVVKNGVEKKGITIGDGNIKPTIYPDLTKTLDECVNEIINIYENGLQEEACITEYDILDLIYESTKYINDDEVLEKIDGLAHIYDNNLQCDYDITEYDLLDILKRMVRFTLK